MKRVLDVAMGLLAIAVLSPLMAAVWVAVRLSGSGPVIFRQDRVGLRGESFEIWKFRTMVPAGAAPTPGLAGAETHRITRLGRLLRRWKLDELPQLWNVVRGDMSLVGPRPEIPSYVDLWPAAARQTILSIRPGLTDRASIAFRHEEEMLAGVDDPRGYYISTIMPAKIQMYERYVTSQSIGEDLRIMGATIKTIFEGK